MARPRAIVAVKGLASHYAEAAKRYGVACELVEDAAAAQVAAQALVQRDDLVLIKGSHGVGLGPLALQLAGQLAAQPAGGAS
jgi:UDP-N-acetylmuramyl pentapeptide synthase